MTVDIVMALLQALPSALADVVGNRASSGATRASAALALKHLVAADAPTRSHLAGISLKNLGSKAEGLAVIFTCIVRSQRSSSKTHQAAFDSFGFLCNLAVQQHHWIHCSSSFRFLQ